MTTTEPSPPHGRIDAALAALRHDATSALEKLSRHRDRAAKLRREADTEARAYAAEYRSIRARGFFSGAQLRELGFPAPRTRQRRKHSSSTTVVAGSGSSDDGGT